MAAKPQKFGEEPQRFVPATGSPTRSGNVLFLKLLQNEKQTYKKVAKHY